MTWSRTSRWRFQGSNRRRSPGSGSAPVLERSRMCCHKAEEHGEPQEEGKVRCFMRKLYSPALQEVVERTFEGHLGDMEELRDTLPAGVVSFVDRVAANYPEDADEVLRKMQPATEPPWGVRQAVVRARKKRKGSDATA